MSDNDMTTRIGFNVDQASVDRAKAAVASLGGTFTKTAAEIEKSKAIENAAKSFIQMAIAEGDAATAAEQLNQRLKALGATDKEIEKVVKAFDREVSAIQRADAAAAKKAANDAARAAKALERDEIAARRENARLDAAKRDADEIAAYRENAERNAAASGGGGATLGQRITRAGSQLRNLPSTQIPGLPIATDAIGNITRLTGVLVDLAGKSSLVTAATNLLTPALGAQAAATIGAAAPMAAFVAGAAAIALALKALTDSTSQNVEEINAFAEAQRSLNDKIAEGLTSKEAQAELDKLNERRRLEEDTLKTLQTAYNQADQQLRQATLAGLNLGNAFSNTAKIFSGDEQALADAIAKSQEIIQKTSSDYNSLENAMEDGRLATNDARVAEEELAKTRSDAALSAAEAAGKELAAQQKALGATEEQNKARLKSIEDEEAVIQRQIEVLQQSGDTSDAVKEKLKALNGQLGALGKESDFINETALAVSKRRDAEKKAEKEAEDAAKKVAKAVEDYSRKQVDIARQSAEKVTDIQRAATDRREDTELKFARDLVALTEKTNFERDRALRKAAEDEYQATLDANRKLEDLRDEALESETESQNERNFLAAAKARENLEKSNKEALKDAARAAEDRKRAFNLEEQERLIQLEQARYERLRSYRQDQIDDQTNLNRQLRDQRIAKTRQLNEANIAYTRELEAQQAFLGAMGVANAVFYQQQVNIASQAAGLASGASGGSTVPLGGGAGSFPGGYSFPAGGSVSGLRPIAPAPALRGGNTITANIYANTSSDVYDAVRRLGFVD